MSSKNLRALLVAGVVASAVGWLLSSAAGAQVLYGTVVGTVRDSSRAVVPGATVTATNTQTNLVLTSVTNEAGNFTIVNVTAGSYDIKVELDGFREFTRTGVPVSANTVSRVDATLDLGTLAESVTVESEAALLQTDSTDVRTELRSREIQDLPLGPYRNYQSLMDLVPGVTPGFFQNPLTDSPARAIQHRVSGQPTATTATTTDGARNVNVWLPHQTMYVSPAETIETVNVATSSFSAEQGMAGGAAITVMTKSGTNEYRGSGFEFFNNERLNARPFFDPEKPRFDRHNVGGTLGGPIVRNQLFFFGSYEGFFERSVAFDFLDVPTLALREGDFSQALNAGGTMQVIYDPLTGSADGTGRQPFPNNVVPPDRISPAAERVLDLYPLPNTGSPDSVTRNYLRQNDTAMDRHNVDIKINWNRTSAHQLWGKYSQMNANVDNLFYLGADGRGEGLTTVFQPTFGQTWTLGPTTVLDSTFGITRNKQDVATPADQLGHFGRDVLGLPGTNGGAGQFANDPRYSGIPRIDTGLSALGNLDPWYPVFRDDRTYAFRTNVTKLAGNHEVRFGYQGDYLTLNHWQPEVDHPRGRFQFGGGTATALNGGPQGTNFYNTYASFLLGLVSTASKSIQFEELTAREWQHALYVQDRWQVNDRLTLNLGLRYEYFPLMTRVGDRGIEVVDFDTMEVVLGGVAGNPKDLGRSVSTTMFAPRFGFVYRLNEATVFRSGYGITYNPLPLARPIRGRYPLTIAGSFTRDNPWGWVSLLDDGIPEVDGPPGADVSTGRVPLPPAVAMVTPVEDLSRGYIQSWNVTLERRLLANTSVDVAYVGTKGTNGFTNLDINASDTPGGGNQSRPFFETFGRNIALQSFGPRARTEYHSLQLGINRPFRNGLFVKGAYTLSKAMGMISGGAHEGGGFDWNAPSEFHRNRALQGFDRTHNLHVAALYELPFARNATGLTKALADGWQVNGVFRAYSGAPFTVTASGAELNMPGNLQTADLVGTPTRRGDIGDDGPYFDPGAWEQPTGVRFGNTGRNSMRGPGGWNADLSVFRRFRVGGTRQVEFRAEAANVFNHPIFGTPNGSITSANFMHIFGTQVGPRIIRLGLRFSF